MKIVTLQLFFRIRLHRFFNNYHECIIFVFAGCARNRLLIVIPIQKIVSFDFIDTEWDCEIEPLQDVAAA